MTNLTPDAKMKVEHVNQSPGNLRPLWQTCFRILLLPQKYPSFYEMKINFKLVSAIFYQIFIFSPYDSPLKTMKNVFYFI